MLCTLVLQLNSAKRGTMRWWRGREGWRDIFLPCSSSGTSQQTAEALLSPLELEQGPELSQYSYRAAHTAHTGSYWAAPAVRVLGNHCDVRRKWKRRGEHLALKLQMGEQMKKVSLKLVWQCALTARFLGVCLSLFRWLICLILVSSVN